MGRKKKTQSGPESTEQAPLQEDNKTEPERFDRSLLLQAVEIRLDYFENHCIIEHTRLLDACDKIVNTVCSPGEGPGSKRPGKMVLVIGPTRVGKTTLIGLLEKQLLSRAKEQMLIDPSFIPFVTINIPSDRFDWVDYYKAVLRAFGDPFVDRRSAALRRGRDWREAMEEAFIQRKPYAVIVDEAQHLAKAARGSSLQSQLDHLKYFENLTGVSHILVGTYEMRPFRKINAQLACRSIDVHFPRYDMTEDEDRMLFQSALWALQCQLPLEEEPPLVEKHWEFLYARSIGCIGQLKMHLNEALALALRQGAKTITKEHLLATALTEDRVKLAFDTAIKGENDLFEEKGADARILEMIWKAKKSDTPSEKEGTKPLEEEKDQPSNASHSKGNKPGNRLPIRDDIGVGTEVDDIESGEQVLTPT